MNAQDNNFNYKIIFAALIAVIIGILIAFYYSWAQSKNQMTFLEQEKNLLVKEITLMKAQVDRLEGLNEVSEIELQTSRFKIQQLMDSVGRLRFSLTKLKETRKELRMLEVKFDSLKLKNNFLQYNNSLLAKQNEETLRLLKAAQGRVNSIEKQEALARQTSRDLSRMLRSKTYSKLEGAYGNGFRLRAGRPLKTNKASVVEKLRGCVTISANSGERGEIKILYLQFMDPDMKVIEDNATTISVNGNVYSKKMEIPYMGKQIEICDAITVPEGSLSEGIYTINVFEDERLLASSEFQLK